MAPRGPLRPHKKVRSGCTPCRARHIKCDEGQPACKNCNQRSLLCGYHGKPTARRTLASARTPSPAGANLCHLMEAMQQSSNSRILTTAVGSAFPKDLDLLHLSLLHHYSTSTCTTSFSHTPEQAVWRNEVPRLAFSHAPVLDAIFAVSALHMSFLNPSEASRYQLVAAGHYQQASAALRRALPLGSKMGPEFAAAVFVTNCLLGVYVFADQSLRSPDVPGALLWMPISRGARIIFDEYRESLQASFFAPVLPIKHICAPAPPGPVAQLPDDIDYLYLTEPDSEEAAVYADAVQKLRETWHWTRDWDFRTATAFIWPNIVSDGFMELLRLKKPRALALVGFYYRTMFSNLEEMWWNCATPRQDLKIIQGMVGTSEKWAQLLGAERRGEERWNPLYSTA
ncbi:hypothetical protein FN846DRAFT_938279 [Sphaerosporella brunnea]|uniref:Zn(2)-C6 fungal-type domain-containing protein n=1 Tax=Sphaerosporella brunnea TaxID=1250544 RepID=A0A5J5F4I4_9PEZI|nr:hypothetical protein FN846DRAFT_938279 [Sphaerosporella brunnea]